MLRLRGLIILFLLALIAEIFPQKYVILEKTPEYMVLKFDLRNFTKVRDTLIGGRKFSYFPGDGMYFMKEGEPAIPEYSVSVGISYNSKPKISVIASERGETENRFILPFSLVDSIAFKPELLFFDKDLYNIDRYFPSALARLEGRYSFRFSEIQPVIVSPYQYNPVSRELVRYNSITVRIDYNIEYSDAFMVTPVNDLATAQFLKNTIINFEDAKKWIGEKKSNLPDNAASQTKWYDPAKQYLKLYLNKRNIYKLTYEELIEAGMPANLQIQNKKLQIFGPQGEIPLAIYGDNDSIFTRRSYIIFAGDSMPPSPHATLNLYNKSNVFWFSYQADTSGLRYKDRDGTIPTPTAGLNFTEWKLHFEEDKIYERLGWAPNGNRDYWFWQRINAFRGVPENGFAHRFDVLPNLAPEATSLRVRAEIHGITTTVYPCNYVHSVNLFINDKKLANLKWNGQDKILYDSTFNILTDSIVIASAGNQFKIVTDGNICLDDRNDELRVNWYELYYYRSHRASGEYFNFKSPPNTGYQTFWIFNWTGDTMFVYVPDRKERIIKPWILRNPQGDVLFRDSLRSDSVEYFAVDADYGLRVDSIKVDVPSNIKNPNNEADYIIIYHPKFKQIADRLAQFRRTTPVSPGETPLRVYSVDVMEIYDEFSGGLMDPFAIKSFLKYAFESFRRPAPLYVTLLGDMSFDYRKILPDSRENYIPSLPFHSIQYGIAASDNSLVALTGEDITPDMAISRLSIETVEEGNIVMGKVENYPGDNTKKWRESVLLMSSGIDEQDELQFGFNRESLKLKDNFLEPKGFNAIAICRYPSNPEEQKYKGSTPEILEAFDKGVVVANYYGHGGGYQWDLIFTNNHIYQLHNDDRLPFVISVTCYTAHYDNQDVFGEQFLKIPNKGAIGFFGSSGLTHWQIGTYFNGLLFDEMFNLKNYVTGLSTLAAKVRTPPVGYYINQIALLTYLGESGLRLAVPTKPDFAIANNDLSFSSTTPLKGDTLSMMVKMSNYGIKTGDSVNVTLSFIASDTSGIISTKRIPVFGNNDSLTFKWATPVSGLITIFAEINPGGLVDEDDLSDNKGQRQIAVYDISEPSLLYPPDGFTSQKFTDIELADIGYYINRGFVYGVEIDTASNFASPLFVLENLKGNEGLLKYSLSVLPPGRYFWRARIVDGQDYGRWSSPRTYSSVDGEKRGYYFKGNLLLNSEIHNLTYSKIYDGLLLNTERKVPRPANPRLKREFALTHIEELDTVGMTCLTTDGKYLYIADYWFDVQKRNPDGKSQIYIVGTGKNGTNQGEFYGTVPGFKQQIRLQMAYLNGHIYYPGENSNVLYKLEPTVGKLDSIQLTQGLLDFDFGDERVVGKYMIAAYDGKIYNFANKRINGRRASIVRVFNPVNWSVERDIELPLIEPYASVAGFFIVGDILYMYEDYASGFFMAARLSDGSYLGEWLSWDTKVLRDLKRFYSWVYDEDSDEIYATVYRRNDTIQKRIAVFAGYYVDSEGKLVSKEIGPATKWNKVNYEIVTSNATSLYQVDLHGLNSTTRQWDTLRVGIPNGFDISGYNPQAYPYMRTVVSMEDTSYSTTNPMFIRSIHVDCETEVPEITISNNDFTFDPDSLIQGFDITVSLKVRNIGKVPSDSTTAKLYLGDADEPFYTEKFKIAADTFHTVSHTINTSKIVFNNKVRAVVTMEGTEMYTFNNIGADSFYVTRDTIKPDFTITFDKRDLINGDIISSNPLIEIVLTDNSPLPLDTTRLSLVLNGKPVGFKKDTVNTSYTPWPNSRLDVTWKPWLKQGKQTLEVFTKDASDIPYSNVAQKYQFFIYDKDDIQQIYNYPNPFASETWFTYELRGNTPPEEVKIKIFTIAGRLIKELVVPSTAMQIGLNKVYWDGRDADGDEIGNGVYLYKLITRYKDRTKTSIEKIAKVK
ncbi:MAG: C25 family cysteine peptidase [Bacteroidetes bacterium]|nr:C25 family cysteine peptidase [Bacteroidota bacterium]